MNEVLKSADRQELLGAVRDARMTAMNKQSVVVDATNLDTGRSTRSMTEQMNVIIAGITEEIKGAEEVKTIVVRRISDLNLALKASRAALEILQVKG